jgi:putative transcriptional regulator
MIALLLAASLLAAPVSPALRRLKPGVFLYAAPGMTSPSFNEAVVLLVRHEGDGSLGLIVNRPTRIPVREILRDRDERRELGLRLHFGGPVEAGAALALMRSVKPIDGAIPVLPGVYFIADAAAVKAAARGVDGEGPVRVYAGYTGWSAGQLATELEQGAWIVGPADAGAIFTSDASSLWPRVYDLLRRIEVRSR